MSQQKIYYFDNNATTRVAPEVVEAMLPFFTEQWGNPSSAYTFGNSVSKRIEGARAQAAALINADPREVVFTSCGTESNNAAIHSALRTNPGKRHIVTTAVEHSANIKFCQSNPTARLICICWRSRSDPTPRLFPRCGPTTRPA